MGKRKSHRTILSFDVGCRNLAFCVLKEIPEDLFVDEEGNCWEGLLELQRWDVVDVIVMAGSRAKNVRNIRIENLVRYMLKSLPMLFTDENMAEVTDILIEQQIRKGIKNIALAYSIMSFFLAKFPRLEKRIHLIGSGQKFRIINHSIPEMVKQEIRAGKRPTGKSKKAQAARYRSNKRLGKAATAKELQEPYLLLSNEIASKYKGGKRDDLADCLLQALVRAHPDIESIPEKVDTTFEEPDDDMVVVEEYGDLEPIDPATCV